MSRVCESRALTDSLSYAIVLGGYLRPLRVVVNTQPVPGTRGGIRPRLAVEQAIAVGTRTLLIRVGRGYARDFGAARVDGRGAA